MPPFEYTPYHNPYVQSMSALIQAQGQAQAEGALRSGQAYGNAIQGIGQDIAQIPGQIQAQKMKALQMQDVQGQIAERNAIAAERQQTIAAAQAGSAAIKGSVDPTTGQVDHEKAAAAWEAAGFPNQANAYRESVQKTAKTAQELTAGQQKIAAGNAQVQQASTNHLGELGAAGIQKLDAGATPIQARDYTLGLIANAASHGLIKEDQANQMVMQAAQAGPDQLRAVYQKMLDAAPTVKSRLVEEELKKAETAKNTAEANKANNVVPKEPKQYEVEVPGPNGPVKKLFSEADMQKGVPAYQKPDKGDKAPDQNKLEQNYRTVLMREVSSRSGTLGTEDAKVVGANHLLTMFHQSYDPKTGDYNIPKSQQSELALGLARLMSPTGQVGVQLEEKIDQETAKGDINKALTYITGVPFNGSTQAVFKMFRDSIQRQGQTAVENRQAAIKYLQGLAPTELDPSRREALEANTLVPLRQSRLVQNPKTGEKALEVSIDGGKTWK